MRAFVLGALIAGATTPAVLADDAKCPPSRYRSARTLIIAHASGDYFGPANSVEMMRQAKAAGADLVDADVRVTKDGVLVASHDDLVKVAATGDRSLSISHSTFAELRTVDLGDSWPGPAKNFPLRAKKVRVPTVAEILGAFPNTRVSLEFKVTGGEAALCSLLRKSGRAADVYVSSAGDAALDRFAPLCPEVTTTVTDAMVPVLQNAQREKLAWCAPVPIGQPPLYRSGQLGLTRDSVVWSQAHGLAVFTWTADDRTSLEYVAKLGVDGVYTARPDLALAILRR